jgi:CheY-like chemotaxis protein
MQVRADTDARCIRTRCRQTGTGFGRLRRRRRPGARAMTQHRNTIPVTILICDDDEDDRLLTQQALEAAHIANTVRFVEDGVELLDYLHQRGRYAGEAGLAPRPGLILLDLNMPNMDGREALATIKADPSLHDIPVIVLSDSRLPEDVVRSYGVGANSFITKPVTFSALVDAVTALGRYWLNIVELPPSAQ